MAGTARPSGASGSDETPSDETVQQLEEARRATAARIDGLAAERDGIMASAELVGTDDEHDPEGATLAFEREQIAALLVQARTRLAALDAALARVRAGGYGVCASCGAVIPAGRLLARPESTTCIACASRPRSR